MVGNPSKDTGNQFNQASRASKVASKVANRDKIAIKINRIGSNMYSNLNNHSKTGINTVSQASRDKGDSSGISMSNSHSNPIKTTGNKADNQDSRVVKKANKVAKMVNKAVSLVNKVVSLVSNTFNNRNVDNRANKAVIKVVNMDSSGISVSSSLSNLIKITGIKADKKANNHSKITSSRANQDNRDSKAANKVHNLVSKVDSQARTTINTSKNLKESHVIRSGRPSTVNS